MNFLIIARMIAYINVASGLACFLHFLKVFDTQLLVPTCISFAIAVFIFLTLENKTHA